MVAHPPAPGEALRDRLRALTASGTPPRVLLVKMSSLGDVIHALPTVEALKPGTRPLPHLLLKAGVG